jgi:prepilin-type N-terminal cleavage/methylation domain-containing protein
MPHARRPGGFTLIELVVVIAVIAVLAGLLVPTLLGLTDKARATQSQQLLREVGRGLQRMRQDTGNSLFTCLKPVYPRCTGSVPPANSTWANPDTCLAGCGTLPLCAEVMPGIQCWGGPYTSRPAVWRTATKGVYGDVWGNDLNFSVSSRGTVTVWSSGPNGVDDGGVGDDLQAGPF